MKNYSKIVLGVILIALGFIFLANNYDWFNLDISFQSVAKWWPILLIVAGLGVFLDSERRVSNPLTVLAISFTIPLAIFAAASNSFKKVTRNAQFNLSPDEDDYERNESYNSDEAKAGRSGFDRNGVRTQNFNVENQIGIERAKLDFGGGAAEFFLETTKNNLFEAKTVLGKGSYKLESDKSGNEVEIDFDMTDSGKNIKFSEEKGFDNKVYLMLNPAVLWDVKMGIGAGDLNFDFSKFRVENLKVETGAASVKIRLSELVNESNVNVQSGVASVNLEVPKGVGCGIDLDGAMNSKNFSGFNKIGNDRWETDNFDSATKKIYIDLDSGLTSLNISRY